VFRSFVRALASTLVIALLGAFVVALPSSAVEPAASTSVSGTVSGPGGTAYNTAANSWAYLYEGEMSVGFSTIDSEGDYTFSDVQPGTYTLGVFSQSIYQNQFYEGAIVRENATPLVVNEGDTITIDIELSTGGSIQGVVTGPNGAALDPAVQVTVTAYSASGVWTRSATVDPITGQYALDGLATDDYRLEFRDMGIYVSEYYSNAKYLGSATPIAVSAGSVVSGVNESLAIGSALAGTVTGPGGGALDPAAQVMVVVLDQDGDYVSDGYVDSNGSFRIGGLPAGEYVVEVRDWSGTYLKRYSGNAATFETASRVVVGAGQTRNNVDVQLVVGGTISGVVTGPDGAQLDGWNFGSVSVLTTEGNYVANGSIDPEGAYRVGSLPAGTYKVVVYPYEGPFTTTYYGGTTKLDDAGTVTVALGADTSGRDIAMIRGGSITGKLTTDDGGALGPDAGVCASTVDGDESHGCSGVSDEGLFAIHGLGGGQHNVWAYSTGGYLESYFPGVSDYDAATRVAVVLGQVTSGIDFELTMGGAIEGRILAPEGMSLDEGNTFVEAHAADGTSYEFEEVVDADGRYRLDGLATGDYRLKFSDRNREYASVYSGGSATLAAATVLPVSARSTTQAGDVRFTVGGIITGKVTGPNSSAIPTGSDAYVTGFDSSGDQVAYAGVQEDGTYRMTGLPVGQIRLQFSTDAEDYASEFYLDKATLDSATPVEVSLANPVSEINASLELAGSLTGTVSAADGSQLPTEGEITVTLYDSAGNVRDTRELWEDGDFTFYGLTPGSYRVKVADSTGAFLTEYFANKTSLASATPINVTAGAPSGPVAVEIDRLAAPSAPTNVVATPGNGTAAVSWAAPSTDGGAPVTGYVVTSLPGGVTCQSVGSTGCTVTGLTNGASYQFTVTAINAVGTSAPSLPSAGVIPSQPVVPPTPPVVPAPVPVPVPVAPNPARAQVLLKAPTTVKRKKSKALPRRTAAGIAARWTTSTPKVCKVRGGKVIAGKRKGVCKLTVVAAGNSTWLPVRQTLRVKVR